MSPPARQPAVAAALPAGLPAGAPLPGPLDDAPPTTIAPHEPLVLLHGKRMVAQYATAADGIRQLHLYFGAAEIVFDEPDLFVFGETLARQSRFTAGDAMRWGPGLSWERLAPMFAALVDQGILHRAGPSLQLPAPVGDRSRPSPLPPATCPTYRSWRAAAEITRELAGRAVEPGYLEVFVPVFRVAHPAMDGDGRQVGEANVFPRPLRIETPTEWATCVYPGTRYLADQPMNLTALKSMRAHWPAMMATLARIRAAYVAREPGLAVRPTVGAIERLAVAVLAVASYPVMRWDRPETPLDPVLSSLFRVTDGLRMVMHQMLFVPIGEPTLPPDAPVSSQMIHAYAERNHAFFSDTGVCAGPQLMVRAFLDVLVEGRPPAATAPLPGAAGEPPPALPPPVRAALADIDAAFDYGLLGLRTHAIAFSLWPLMTRTYERIATLCTRLAARAADAGEGEDRGILATAARMAMLQERLASSPYLAKEAWRAERDHVYADMYARCGEALGRRGTPDRRSCDPDPGRAGRPGGRRAGTPTNVPSPLPVSSAAPALADLIRPTVDADYTDLRARIAGRLASHMLGPNGSADPSVDPHGGADIDPDIAALADLICDYAARTRAILAAAEAAQAPINRLLHRPAPTRRLDAADLDVHNRLAGADAGRLPYLPDELGRTFDLPLAIDSQSVTIR